MKILILSTAIFLFSILELSSQIYTPSWTIQGTSGNDNVGIGTSNPQGRLDIEGLLRLGWNSPYYGIGMSTTGIGGGGWARRYGFFGRDSGSILGGFGGYGSENTLEMLWIGKRLE